MFKSVLIKKLEDELKVAKEKEKARLADMNNKAMTLIVKELIKSESFRAEFEALLLKNNLEKSVKIIQDTYLKVNDTPSS